MDGLESNMKKVHNKGKTRIKYVGGKYGYISTRERLSPLFALGFSILCGVISLGYGNYARAQQLHTEDVNPAMENNLVQSFFSQYGVEEQEEKSERQQILEYIVEVFGDESANAITMIRKCENSKFDPKATNWNRNGTADYSIMQINDVNESLCKGLDFRNDWRDNIDCGYRVFKQAGYKWTPWACAEEIGQIPFWKK